MSLTLPGIDNIIPLCANDSIPICKYVDFRTFSYRQEFSKMGLLIF